MKRKKLLAMLLSLSMIAGTFTFSGSSTNAKEKTSSVKVEELTEDSEKREDTTKEYLADNLKTKSVKKTAKMSDEYWEEEAPADAAEAGEMYLAGAKDEEYDSKTLGASNVKDSVDLDDQKVDNIEKKYDKNGLRQIDAAVTVTYTVANNQKLKVDNLNDLFDKNPEGFLTSMVSTASVYEMKGNDDVYVAYLNMGGMNGIGEKILDAEFVTGEQHNPVDASKDITFDKKTGIVYIPKAYYFATDGTDLGYDLQAQIFVCPDTDDASIDVTIDNQSKADATFTEKQILTSAYDSVTVPIVSTKTAGKIDKNDVKVYFNDSAVAMDMSDIGSYNEETGEYTINQLAANIYSLKFEIKGQKVSEKIKSIFGVEETNAKVLSNASTAGAQMNAVKNVSTGNYISPSIDFDNIKEKETYDYNGKNSKGDASKEITTIATKMLKAGQNDFIYAPYLPKQTKDIRDTFYNCISDSDKSGAVTLEKLINKIKEEGSKGLVDAEDQNNNAGTGETADYTKYDWYNFIIGAPSGTLTETDSKKKVSFGKLSEWKWSNTFKVDGEDQFQTMFAAMCCHAEKDLVEGKKKNQVSILEKTDDYVVLGLLQTAEGSTKEDGQAGATVIKVMRPSAELSIKKVSANTSITDGNNCYSLEGAVFGVYNEEGTKVGSLTTKADGTTDSLKLQKGKYTLKEEVVPRGYKKAEDATVDLQQDTVKEIADVPSTDPLGIFIYKQDAETKSASKLGNADLEGAQFEVKYYDGYYTADNLPEVAKKTWVLETKKVEDSSLIRANFSTKISGDDLYSNSGVKGVLPLGTITVQEIKAPEGYNTAKEITSFTGETKSSSGLYVTQIKQNNNYEAFVTAGNECTADEQVYRGNLEFIKKDADTQKKMAGIPFKITSNTTGESHIVVTDENGQFSSKGLKDYNANDDAMVDGKIDESKLNADAGIWFGQYDESKMTEANDDLGALPYDTYTIEELKVDANKDRKMIKDTFTVSKDEQKVDLGTLNNFTPLIETTAKNEATGTHYANADKDLTIIDTVDYSGLEKGKQYTLKGTLMNKETGEAVVDGEGNAITSEKTFTTKKTEGTIEVEFNLDASSLAGSDLVVFEELYVEGEEEMVTDHKDLTSDSQTIHLPGIKTEAQDVKTEMSMSNAEKEMEIQDTVSYSGLKPNKEYTMTGTLMDKETGEAVLDDDGNKITAEKKFTPETSEGKVVITFKFSGVKLAGKTLVAFENVDYKGDTLATHADINDEAQTVYVPEVKTTAVDDTTKSHVGLLGESTITDTVSYSNVIVGKEYTITGQLMDKESGKEIEGAIASTTFTAEETSGTVTLTFKVDGTLIQGKSLVAFETLAVKGEGEDAENKTVGEHKDLEDSEQTVYYPEVKTNAVDGTTKEHVGVVGKTTVVDTVSYKNLVAGQEYTVNGTLMNKEDGSVLAEATTKFTPEKSEGSVDLTFEVDATSLAGKHAVAFEDLYFNDQLVGQHRDLEDQDQTVSYPTVKTTLKGKKTNSHEVGKGKSTKVVDTVVYTGLTPGLEYTVKGKLMNKKTGKAIATAEKKFTAKEANGSVDITFTFNSTNVSSAVAFEDLYLKETKIATHSDINDKNQTVTVKSNPKTVSKKSSSVRTGDNHLIFLGGAMLLLGFGMVIYLRKRQR